jgi:hypothetical protein
MELELKKIKEKHTSSIQKLNKKLFFEALVELDSIIFEGKTPEYFNILESNFGYSLIIETERFKYAMYLLLFYGKPIGVRYLIYDKKIRDIIYSECFTSSDHKMSEYAANLDFNLRMATAMIIRKILYYKLKRFYNSIKSFSKNIKNKLKIK